ncbi:adenine phosphoribosyltransferase [Parapedobacter lycopersici]|uniref:adenine phosphoribosyltransferase n=1 Tax=Parapedobacter lycopersici TaxID=1864939 RepID=UPI003341B858
MIDQQLKAAIRDVPDFPRKGVVFKDITPLLQDPELCNAILDEFIERLDTLTIDVVAGIESRGFLFGLMLANRLGVPFVPIRKQGKLPYLTVTEEYELEYGHAAIEVHRDAFPKDVRVLIHDDLLATGGTVSAASRLVQQLGGIIEGYAFIVALTFLHGKKQLLPYSPNVISLVDY